MVSRIIGSVYIDMRKVAQMSFLEALLRVGYDVRTLTNEGRQVALAIPFCTQDIHHVSFFRLEDDLVSSEVLDDFSQLDLQRVNPFVLLEYVRLCRTGQSTENLPLFFPVATLFDVAGKLCHSLFTAKSVDVDEALSPTWDAGVYLCGERLA
jgi:virulence-associated protein VapD